MDPAQQPGWFSRPDFGKASGHPAQDIDLPGHLRCFQLTGYWFSVCSHLKIMNGRENNVHLHSQPHGSEAVHSAKNHTSCPKSHAAIILASPEKCQKSLTDSWTPNPNSYVHALGDLFAHRLNVPARLPELVGDGFAARAGGLPIPGPTPGVSLPGPRLVGNLEVPLRPAHPGAQLRPLHTVSTTYFGECVRKIRGRTKMGLSDL